MSAPDVERRRRPIRDNTRALVVGMVALLALLAALLTLASRSSQIAPDVLTEFVLYALSATNLTILVALGFVLARNIVKLVVERRRGLPFARFRAKLVAVLLGMTIVPAVLVLLVGSEVIRNSVDRWFNAPMNDVLSAANAIAVVQGEISMAFQPLAAAIPRVEAGRLKGIAVTGVKRARAVPEIPTVGETVRGYTVEAWYGLVVPARTPRPLIVLLNRESNRVLAAADVADTLMKNGIEPEGGTPEAFAALINEDAARMAKLVKEAGIKFD